LIYHERLSSDPGKPYLPDRGTAIMAESTGLKQNTGRRFLRWLLEERIEEVKGPEASEGEEQRAWWQGVCLTDGDYFSPFGYLPGYAATIAAATVPRRRSTPGRRGNSARSTTSRLESKFCSSRYRLRTPRSSWTYSRSGGVEVGDQQMLRSVSSVVPNTIAAFLLHLYDTTGKTSHCYFGWT
jgi:hypothetical protein